MSSLGTVGLGRAAQCRKPLVAAFVSALLAAPALACPPAPPPVKDLDVPRFYGDQEGSVVDPRLAEAHKAAVAPLTDFLRHVTADADKAWKRAKPVEADAAGHCALAWITAWASGEAWLGDMRSRQGEYQRKWDLAGVALAYLKVRPLASQRQRAVIEPWLTRFADATRAFFDDRERKRNNHWYWQGLALAAVALATDSERHWEMARGIMQDAARDIGADGTLPMELERKGRALHYHAFALTALVPLAELGRLANEDWAALNNGALHRLVDVTLRGLADPALFDRLAGAPQERPPKPGYGWPQLYAAHYRDRLKGPLPQVPASYRWLGGDVEVLVQALRRER